ncbi:MAG: N-acetyltransferase [Candidatus Thorarchaeota archaeon]|nr:MAG: N-acetyltransferase [Candidatus Thorarchaeota archaeon]
MEDYEIHTIDVATASDEDWAKFHSFRRKRMLEVLPDDPVEDDLSVQEWERTMLDENYVKVFIVTQKDRPDTVVASLRMDAKKETSPSYVGNKHNLVTRLAVLKEHRGKGIAKTLLKLVHGFALEKGRSVILGGTMEDDGRKLNRILGGTEALEMRNYRLNINDIDWKMVEQWEKEGKERSPDTTLEFHTSIPEDILERYTKKYSEVFNQAPFDDLDIGDQIYTPELFRKYEEVAKKMGQTWLTVLLREKNGDISGLSDVIYMPSRAPLLEQFLTGVDQNYRGQGKGKWVKAAMLLRIREEFPDVKVVTTGNAKSNAPMIAINERLGFKLHHETFNMQIETEKLGQYLKGQQ